MDELDRILSSPDDLEPSAGFVQAVLAAACRDQAPPLAFPWLRFGIGVGACVVMALAGTTLLPQAAALFREAGLGPLAAELPELRDAALAVAASLALGWLPKLFALRRAS